MAAHGVGTRECKSKECKSIVFLPNHSTCGQGEPPKDTPLPLLQPACLLPQKAICGSPAPVGLYLEALG
jgi:hypothetical protein